MHMISTSRTVPSDPSRAELINRILTRLLGFLFPRDDGRWLSILRIGLGMQVVLYTLSLAGDWHLLLGDTTDGLVGRAFPEALLWRESPLIPTMGWLIWVGARVGLSEWNVLSMAWALLLVAGFGLIGGVFSRASAILAWVVHLCVANSGDLLSYGVDSFMTIGLFYLMLAPLPDNLAIERRWRGRQDRQFLGFWRRVLQVHLCFIYFFGGLSKALGAGWWNGTNLWRILTRSPFNLIPPETLIGWKYVFPAAGIAVVLLELGYPFGIWPNGSRGIWLIGIMLLHLGIALFMGMYLFSMIMIVLNAAAFAPEIIWAGKSKRAASTFPGGVSGKPSSADRDV